MKNNNQIKLEKIKFIISDLKLNKKIYFTEFLNFNKCITYFEKENFILKFNFDKTFLNFSINEEIGYKNRVNFSKIYNIPKYETLLSSEEIHVSKIEFLGKKKGNYFNGNQFINNTHFKNNLFKKNVSFYLLNIKKKYDSILLLEDKKKINHEINLFLKNEGEFILPVNISHGDFVHWNTRIFKSKYYCYDLEQYDEERLYCYDIIHWYLMPFLQKINFTKSKFFKNKILKLFNIFLKNKLKETFPEFQKTDYYKFLFLYLFEKKMYYLMLINSGNILEKTSSVYYNQLIYLNYTIQHLIDNILKINER